MSDISEAKAKIKRKVKSHLPKDWITELRITYRNLIILMKINIMKIKKIQ